MKPGAYLINNSRGTVVDLDALAARAARRPSAGAAIDVFPVEPASNAERFGAPLQGLDNVILTPHVGGSTEEAQERIGGEVARKLVDYFDHRLDHGRGQFPAGAVAAASRRHALHPCSSQRAGHAAPAERGVPRSAASTSPRNICETDGDVGYVVLDADLGGEDSAALLAQIRALEGTVGARLVFRALGGRHVPVALRGLSSLNCIIFGV